MTQRLDTYQTEEPPLGLVLAGGNGRRMGGNKPHQLLGKRSLIEIVLDRLSRVCPRQAIVTWNLEDFVHLPAELIRDRWPGEGPLAALATAFLETGAQSILTLPVDLPFVSLELLEQLCASHRAGLRAAAPEGPMGLEPLVAYYHHSCLAHATGLLKKGERRPRRLLRLVHFRRYTWPEVQAWDHDGSGFMNLNSKAELAQARLRMAGECVK